MDTIFRMSVKVIREAGYEEALLGLSLSYEADLDRMPDRALKQAALDGGHNKFLESICVWIDINAPRYWWQEMDTYRIGITKQSGSTMHSLKKRPVTQEDFVRNIFPPMLSYLNWLVEDNAPLTAVKENLPEGYLQRRIVCTNYKTLRWIFLQRKTHRLKEEWGMFIRNIREGVQHPELLP